MASNTFPTGRRIIRLLGSNKFFYFIVVLFVLESVWIALSGRYPMAFDEDYHLGIIKFYAQQWSPFFAAQPAGADTLGAIVRDPSYLQHYLFSFPYRLTHALFHSDFIDVLTLRFIGVAAMAAGLFIYRRVLGMVNVSTALVNAVLLMFVLVPVVPFLAGQINYDNVLFPVCGLVLLLALQFRKQLMAGRFDTPRLVVLLSICMLASLIKYSFLPVFFAVIVYIGLEMKRAVGAKGITLRRLAKDARREFIKSRQRTKLGLVVLVAVSAGLFISMYGYNFVRYHTPIPECDQVLDIQHCLSYGAWSRNYHYMLDKGYVDTNPLMFTVHWANTYLTSFVFALNGIYSGFIVARPFPVLHIGSMVVALLGLALIVWRIRRLWQEPALRLFIIAGTMYIVALWLQNYSEYVHLGQHVAEQGRYLILLLPALFMVFAYALKTLADLNFPLKWFRENPVNLKLVLLGSALLIFTQGGGILTYAARSDPSWWWENNAMPYALNQTVQPFIRPWLIGSNRENLIPWNVTDG